MNNAMNAELNILIERARCYVSNMSIADKRAMSRRQRDSIIKAELAVPKPRYQMIDGVQVYPSYADYCND